MCYQSYSLPIILAYFLDKYYLGYNTILFVIIYVIYYD